MNPFYLLISAAHKAPPLLDFDFTVFIQFGLFVVLLLALSNFVFRPYLQLKESRETAIGKAKSDADNLNVEVEERLKSYEDRIAYARKEAAQSRTTLKQDAEKQAIELLTRARLDAEKQVAIGQKKLNESIPALEASLKSTAGQLALMISNKVLGRS